MTMEREDHISLKWGTLKAWNLNSAKGEELLKRYFECIHCRAIYGPTDEQCPRCGAFEAARCKTPNVI